MSTGPPQHFRNHVRRILRDFADACIQRVTGGSDKIQILVHDDLPMPGLLMLPPHGLYCGSRILILSDRDLGTIQYFGDHCR